MTITAFEMGQGEQVDNKLHTFIKYLRNLKKKDTKGIPSLKK